MPEKATCWTGRTAWCRWERCDGRKREKGGPGIGKLREQERAMNKFLTAVGTLAMAWTAGTAMGWVLKDDAGEGVLVGNLGYAFTGTDGGRNWNNGGGIQLQDDVAGDRG